MMWGMSAGMKGMTVGLCAIGPPLCWVIYTVSVAAGSRSLRPAEITEDNRVYFIKYFILSGPRAQERRRARLFSAL